MAYSDAELHNAQLAVCALTLATTNILFFLFLFSQRWTTPGGFTLAALFLSLGTTIASTLEPTKAAPTELWQKITIQGFYILSSIVLGWALFFQVIRIIPILRLVWKILAFVSSGLLSLIIIAEYVIWVYGLMTETGKNDPTSFIGVIQNYGSYFALFFPPYTIALLFYLILSYYYPRMQDLPMSSRLISLWTSGLGYIVLSETTNLAIAVSVAVVDANVALKAVGQCIRNFFFIGFLACTVHASNLRRALSEPAFLGQSELPLVWTAGENHDKKMKTMSMSSSVSSNPIAVSLVQSSVTKSPYSAADSQTTAIAFPPRSASAARPVRYANEMQDEPVTGFQPGMDPTSPLSGAPSEFSVGMYADGTIRGWKDDRNKRLAVLKPVRHDEDRNTDTYSIVSPPQMWDPPLNPTTPKPEDTQSGVSSFFSRKPKTSAAAPPARAAQIFASTVHQTVQAPSRPYHHGNPSTYTDSDYTSWASGSVHESQSRTNNIKPHDSYLTIDTEYHHTQPASHRAGDDHNAGGGGIRSPGVVDRLNRGGRADMETLSPTEPASSYYPHSVITEESAYDGRYYDRTAGSSAYGNNRW